MDTSTVANATQTASNDDTMPPKPVLTPPASDEGMEKQDDVDSELSDIDMDEDEGEIEPDHYFDGGKIPVFKPTMAQFRDFQRFIDKIDRYGMQSGIVKIIPPPEWRDSLPDLSEAVKTIKVKNPITQEFSGTHGTYTQANIEKQRSYNLPQWKALTEELNHQPPVKRGERKKQEAPARSRSTRQSNNPDSAASSEPREKRRPGRPRKRPLKEETADDTGDEPQVPPSPSSPTKDDPDVPKQSKEPSDTKKKAAPKAKGRQPASKSVSSRRLNNIGAVAEEVDEVAFKNFDYKLQDVDQYSLGRCQDLEKEYWKTLNYGSPMYGADMPGSLFEDSTECWNVAKLPNLLDVIGQKLPGVNTAYLYLGMWKATFAWHLEDVDLYSINYIHFGAPKQWYSISQADARKFEQAMKSIWPNDAKNCSQFLRHKTYLVSPTLLEKQYGIKVNKMVHYEGEFVITYPYGYHSGFNLGYNCAESVNFANEAWLNYGRIAKKCECEPDSVWIDVPDIERRLRGEPTPEYYEEVTDDEDDDMDDAPDNNLPSPPASVKKAASRKRKRDAGGKDAEQPTKKKIRIRIKAPSRIPCVLCPNDVVYDTLLPTDNGQQAHRLCAELIPETYIGKDEQGNEKVCNIANIDKARLELKCNFCRVKRGACFQCHSKKCTRAYHATCAAAAGVQIDTGPTPEWDENGIEYIGEGSDLRCRFHRPKRAKNADSDVLENSKPVREFAKTLQPKEVVQFLYTGQDFYGGVVVENRPSEMTVVLDVQPDGDRIEVEWKYLTVLDQADSQRTKPSADAKPMPEEMKNRNILTAKNEKDLPPEAGEAFHDPNLEHKWAEFTKCAWSECRNPFQKQVDLSKSEQLWYYLGKTSTEAKAQFTEDPSKPRHNARANFLDTVRPAPPRMPPVEKRKALPAAYPYGVNVNALNGAMAAQRQAQTNEKPYVYKPKNSNSKPLPQVQQQYPQYHSHHSSPYVQPRSQQYSPPQSQYAQYPPRPISHSPYGQQHPQYQQQHQPHQSPYHHSYYSPQPNTPIYHQWQHPLQHAPVAKMSGASPPSKRPTSSSRPSTSHSIRPPSQSSRPASSSIEYLSFISKFPYLKQSLLRRPQDYVSPYLERTGFSDACQAWLPPRPTPPVTHISPYAPVQPNMYHQATPQTSSQPPMFQPKPQYGLQFSTDQQWQQDVSRAPHQSPPNPQFSERMQRLKEENAKTSAQYHNNHHSASGSSTTPPSDSLHGPTCLGPSAMDPNASHQTPLVETTKMPAFDDKTRTWRHLPSPISEGKGRQSPTRPEYSPLSDAGGSDRRDRTLPPTSVGPVPAGSGMETWRFG